jgi:hypothetical protein
LVEVAVTAAAVMAAAVAVVMAAGAEGLEDGAVTGVGLEVGVAVVVVTLIWVGHLVALGVVGEEEAGGVRAAAGAAAGAGARHVKLSTMALQGSVLSGAQPAYCWVGLFAERLVAREVGP